MQVISNLCIMRFSLSSQYGWPGGHMYITFLKDFLSVLPTVAGIRVWLVHSDWCTVCVLSRYPFHNYKFFHIAINRTQIKDSVTPGCMSSFLTLLKSLLDLICLTVFAMTVLWNSAVTILCFIFIIYLFICWICQWLNTPVLESDWSQNYTGFVIGLRLLSSCFNSS